MKTFSVLLSFAFLGLALDGCGKKDFDPALGPSIENPDSTGGVQPSLEHIQNAALDETDIASQLSVVLYAAVERGQVLRVWKPRLLKSLVCQESPSRCRSVDSNVISENKE